LPTSNARTKVSTTAAILSASPGVIAQLAGAGGGRLHRRGNVAGLRPAGFVPETLSIGGSANLTVRSRQDAKIGARQKRIAVGSPTRASSTALRVSAAPVPLFPLFYLVEIRHPQLLKSQSTPLTGSNARVRIMRLW
jgi:hypothetical protein